MAGFTTPYTGGKAGLTPNTGTTDTTTSTAVGPKTSTSNFKMTDGWYVALACVGSVMVANTRFGPIAFGILTIALIYQTTLLLEGK